MVMVLSNCDGLITKIKPNFKPFCTTTTPKSSNLYSSDLSGSSTKIKLQTFEISLLDNVPNNLVGCVIQKRKGTYLPNVFFTQHHFQNRYLTYQPLQKDDQFPDEKKASLLRINHQSQKQKKVGPEVKNTRSSREVRSW